MVATDNAYWQHVVLNSPKFTDSSRVRVYAGLNRLKAFEICPVANPYSAPTETEKLLGIRAMWILNENEIVTEWQSRALCTDLRIQNSGDERS
jgi:hypothetical protein